MTVAVACNISDGVILGVDSAVTIQASSGAIANVYENADKLFQLGNRPIGVAFYGLGEIEGRSIGSHLREFERSDPTGVISRRTGMKAVVEQLRKYFWQKYRDHILKPIAKELGVKPSDVPEDKQPPLGLVVGGFSAGKYQSEVWDIVLPRHRRNDTANQSRPPGSFGTSWYAMYAPIARYIKGYDYQLIQDVFSEFGKIRGTPLTDSEIGQIAKVLGTHEYGIPFGAMPMMEGVKHTRFLVEMVINHHRFAFGAPVVGGKCRIGMVTYRGEKFQILEDGS